MPVFEDGSDLNATGSLDADVMERLAQVMRSTGRTSDAIGTLGPGEFAVVAQGTDPAGAARLGERLSKAASEIFASTSVRVAVGYDAVKNYSEAPMEPTDMLQRASLAMRASRSEATFGARPSIRRFEGPLN